MAVRPIGPLERGLDWLVLPARVLAELTGPLGWLQARDVQAADGGVAARRALELEQQVELEDAVLRMARPDDFELAKDLRARGIKALRAEVVERPDGHLDRLLVRVEDPSCVHKDLPVVSGDVYVGRLDLAATRDDGGLPPDLFLVNLVTGADFRIGAAIPNTDCRLVVGGLAALPDLRLDVHNPSNRRVTSGTVVVQEPKGAEGGGELANGFLLGDMLRESSNPEEPGQRLSGIVPRLDYATGLHQVQVLLPPEAPAPRPAPRVAVAADGRWVPARLFLRAEITPGRAGRKLALGRRQGVLTGAALASGARFAGRVIHAGVVGSEVGLFGDPGLTVPALAMIETGSGPRVHVLGRLTCLGRDGDLVRVRWPASLVLGDEFDGVSARIWTGSGEALVPRGLLLGDTVLPAGPGPHVLELRLPEDGLEPKGLAVRLPLEETQ